MPNDIKEKILKFYERLASDPNHRYRSWEHCYAYFRRRTAFTTREQLDTAALHLAFYLASWGMYRGSSALLWKDYKIHQPVILKLLEPEFDILWDVNVDDSTHDGTTADSIMSLSTALSSIYRQQITTVDGTGRDFQPTDTLITKILLGTVGCTPACDRYFILGFRHAGLHYSRFSPSFLREIISFCREHRDTLRETQQAIEKRGEISYPFMKLADMYFWKIGFDLSPGAESDEVTNET